VDLEGFCHFSRKEGAASVSRGKGGEAGCEIGVDDFSPGMRDEVQLFLQLSAVTPVERDCNGRAL
jgi:hypothetical protein